MRVLVVGSGGREHALVWKIHQSPLVKELYCAPGNAGISEIADCVPIDAASIIELADFATEIKIDLTVVGPELPLSLGIADEFAKRGLRVFGPRRDAAELETSKVFAKEFMLRNGIPTAPCRIFRSEEEALKHLGKKGTAYPTVVKADGLAQGKGVVVAADRAEAEEAVRSMMSGRRFGSAGDAVLIEDCLVGTEASFFALCDGSRVAPWPTSQDYKRAMDGDEGPNTGGMGCYSPSPFVDRDTFREITTKILTPTVVGMNKEGRTYRGILYVGLMLTEEGPQVLEYNCRLGDPEAEVLLPRMADDIVPLLSEAADGTLPTETPISWKQEAAVTVVLASGGYPGSYGKGKRIEGLAAGEPGGPVVFHAGTRKAPDGSVETAGGRVLAVTALGSGLEEAAAGCYQAVSKISFEGVQYRKDIAKSAIEHLARSREESS